MRVIKDKDGGIVRRVLLLDDGGEPVVPVVRYLGHLIDAGYSPHTACAYGYDLRYLFEFLGAEGVSWQAFGPSTALIFLGHLRRRPTRRPAQRLGLAVATGEGRLLAPATVQRVLAATSSFYEWAIAAGEYAEPENPLRREIDPALPRPLEGEEVQAVLDSMATLRDLAMTLLMLDGGLRPGEVLGLHLDDVAYGRRRVTIRKRDDHPHGARGKSRHERVVDLHQPRTLDAVSRYVLHERPLVQHIAAHRIQRPRLVQIDYPLVPGLPTSAVRMVVALADRHPPTAVGDVVQVQTQDLPWTQAAIEHQQRHRQVPQRCHAVQHRLHLLALQRPVRRAVRVRLPMRLPRPLEGEEVQAVLDSMATLRDLAMTLLMLDGGLRPGEVLGLHLDDVAYGRRRVTIRKRDDHPHGARGKSRHERVVDLHQPRTLDAVSRYVLHERPLEAASPFLFLVGGTGERRTAPLSYQALVRGFARRLDRLGIRSPDKTPHALRHTHATAMWEGGMRELALQRRLGHASPESTRIYTRVSDEQVLSEYQRALGSGT